MEVSADTVNDIVGMLILRQFVERLLMAELGSNTCNNEDEAVKIIKDTLRAALERFEKGTDEDAKNLGQFAAMINKLEKEIVNEKASEPTETPQ